MSYIAAGLASSLKIEEVVEIANLAAGVVVNKTGTSVAHLSEVLLSINKNNYHLVLILKNQCDKKILKRMTLIEYGKKEILSIK